MVMGPTEMQDYCNRRGWHTFSAEVRKIAASAVSQDETRGQREPEDS